MLCLLNFGFEELNRFQFVAEFEKVLGIGGMKLDIVEE